jgi:hypothetical protein
MWYWFNDITESWIQATESDKIEQEYQSHLNGNRSGQIVYHCFGNRWSALINFDTMTTCCGSGRCMLTHEQHNLSNNHMTYKLKRE